MFCSECGREIRDDAAFCPYCGKPTNQYQQANTDQDVHAGSKPRYEQDITYENTMPNKADSVKLLFGSGLFLVVCILYTVYIFARFGNGLMTSVNVLFFIPGIIICIGCWIAFYNNRTGKTLYSGLHWITAGLYTNVGICLFLFILSAIPAIYTMARYFTNMNQFTEAQTTLTWTVCALAVFYLMIPAIPLSMLASFISQFPQYGKDLSSSNNTRDTYRQRVNRKAVPALTFYFLCGTDILCLFRLFGTSFTNHTNSSIFEDILTSSQTAHWADNNMFGDIYDYIVYDLLPPLMQQQNSGFNFSLLLLIIVSVLLTILVWRLWRNMRTYERNDRLSNHI